MGERERVPAVIYSRTIPRNIRHKTVSQFSSNPWCNTPEQSMRLSCFEGFFFLYSLLCATIILVHRPLSEAVVQRRTSQRSGPRLETVTHWRRTEIPLLVVLTWPAMHARSMHLGVLNFDRVPAQ